MEYGVSKSDSGTFSEVLLKSACRVLGKKIMEALSYWLLQKGSSLMWTRKLPFANKNASVKNYNQKWDDYPADTIKMEL